MKDETIVIAGTEVLMANFPTIDEEVIVKTFLKFIDVANTSTNRSTFYNSQKEQNDATKQMHQNLYGINRGLYAATLLLDGVTDHTKMIGLETLLGISNNVDRSRSLISIENETQIIAHVLTQLPVQRMLNLYLDLKAKRVNNSRTRKIILMSILNSKSLEYWSVKYRNKIRESIEHAVGKRRLSIIKNILNKQNFVDGNLIYSTKEQFIIHDSIMKFVNSNSEKYVAECLSFVLGIDKKYTLPTLKSFVDAKKDLKKGSKLPREVLEGLRSTYHKDVKTAEVIEVTKENLTDKEKIKVQKNAAKHGVTVEFDATKQDVVTLYIHSYANGNKITPEILETLKRKAEQSAKSTPIAYETIGILVDGSISNSGSDTQKLRPIATSLAIRDLLVATSKKSFVEYAGGQVTEEGLVIPAGETNLAKGLIKILKQKPDAIFILSDGYENAPAGRVNEVIEAVRKMKNETPIFQISPVLSGEVAGVKKLSEKISALPVSKPEAIGFSMVKAMLEQNVRDGVIGLFNITLPKIELK